MKRIAISLLLVVFLLPGCSKKLANNSSYGRKVEMENFVRRHSFKDLAQIYYDHGNFINSKQFPPIVTPVEVYKHLRDWLIIDLRSPEAYEAGHINGAYLVPKNKVIDFLKNKQKAAAYEKGVFVCYSGQTASYVTGITRYAGFDNTYAMLFGMAGWNADFSTPVKKGFGDRYPEMIEKASYGEDANEPVEHYLKKPDLNKLPKLPALPPSILMDQQAKKLLAQKRPEFLLKVDEFVPWLKKDPGNLYPLFYIDKAKFYEAHLKGSHQYTPRKDLSLDARLTELPTDKTIVVYCKTGHTGGNTAAYLGMMGYKAENLIFGAGSFMYSLWKEKGWTPDVSAWIHDYPYIEGKNRLSKKMLASPVPGQKKKPAVINVPKRKKKEVTGGCG